MSPEARIDRVNQLKLCNNCLKSNHDYAGCKSTMKCGVCTLPHNYLLHRDKVSIINSSPQATEQPSRSHVQTLQTCVAHRDLSARTVSVSADTDNKCIPEIESYSVILGTARLHIKDACSNNLDCRAIIDSGAQSSFITMDCAQRLGLPRKHCPFAIYGLGGESVKNYGMVTCNVKSRYTDEPYFVVNMVVVSKVSSDMPNVSFPDSVIGEYTQ